VRITGRAYRPNVRTPLRICICYAAVSVETFRTFSSQSTFYFERYYVTFACRPDNGAGRVFNGRKEYGTNLPVRAWGIPVLDDLFRRRARRFSRSWRTIISKEKHRPEYRKHYSAHEDGDTLFFWSPFDGPSTTTSLVSKVIWRERPHQLVNTCPDNVISTSIYANGRPSGPKSTSDGKANVVRDMDDRPRITECHLAAVFPIVRPSIRYARLRDERTNRETFRLKRIVNACPSPSRQIHENRKSPFRNGGAGTGPGFVR